METQKEQLINSWENNIYKTLDNSIILHEPTIEFLIKQRDWDALILFIFYCYCSKLQKNSKRVWVSNSFAAKNLKWRKQRILQARKKLTDYGIIKAIQLREKIEKTDGVNVVKRKEVIGKWLIEIKPLLNAQNIMSSQSTTESQEVPIDESSRGSHSEPVENGNHSSIVITSEEFNSNNYIILHSENETNETTKGKDINRLLDLFSKINPSYKQLFKNKTQRQAIERLVNTYGIEKIEQIINLLSTTNKMPYAPIITTPLELENKLGRLLAFIQKEKNKNTREIFVTF